MKKWYLTSTFLLAFVGMGFAQKPEPAVPVGHSERILSIAFSADGKYALSGSEDKSIKLWELTDGKLLKSWEPYRDEVGMALIYGVGFAKDNKYILCGAGVIGNPLQSLELGRQDTGNLRVFLDPAVVPVGAQPSVRAMCMNADGSEALTLTSENELKLWNVRNGKLSKVFAKHPVKITALCLSPDDRWAFTGHDDGSVQRWDMRKGQPENLFPNVNAGEVHTISVSPDGLVLSGSLEELKLWQIVDNTAAADVFTFPGSYAPFSGQTAVFSPDGKQIAYGKKDNSIVLWDVAARVATDTLTGHRRQVSALRYAPDGNRLISGSFDKSLIMWDVETGEQVLALNGYSKIIKQAFFTSNKKYAVVVPEFSQRIVVWDTESGGVTRVFEGHENSVITASVSANGKYLLSSGDDKQLILWDFQTGQKLAVLPGHKAYVHCLAISPDEKYALSGSDDQTVLLWDLDNRKLLKTFKDHTMKVTTVAFSPDGKWAMTGADDNTVKIFGLEQSNLLFNFKGQERLRPPVVFSPDGKSFLSISCENAKVEWWDIAEKKIRKSFSLQYDPTQPETKMYCGTSSRIAFSPDGTHFLLSSGNHVLLWNLDSESPIYLRGHQALVKTVAFSPDGKLAISGGYDGSVRVWDGKSGEARCMVFHLNDKDWVALTPSGLFDASPGAMKSMYFVLGMETIELEQLKNRYYEPDLLPVLMGFKKGSLRNVEALGELALYPDVTAVIKHNKLDIDLKKRTGGYGKVSVAINGTEVLADACGGKSGCKIDLGLFASHFFSTDSLKGQNVIKVRATNDEGWLKSPEVVLYPYSKISRGEGGDSGDDDFDIPLGNAPDPSLYVVVVGTSDYAGSNIDLNFPDKDARAMARVMTTIASGTALFQDRVYVTQLTTDATDPALLPSKANIGAVFKKIGASARAEDVLMIFFAGHGVTYSDRGKDDFFYLTKDVGNMNLDAADIRNNLCISTDTLSAWISSVPAKKRVVIFDACHSGRAAETLTSSRAPQSSQKRELERLKDRNGMFVLAASESNQKSWEDRQLQQGLLTYSLLFGLHSRKGVRPDGAVDVQGLFQFARDYVPQLANGINEDQTPVLTVPDKESSSFSIGWVSGDTKIEAGRKSEFIVQSMFLNKEGFNDDVQLSVAFDQRLEAGEVGGPIGKMIFANTRQMNEACAIRGLYLVRDGKITLEGRVFLPGKAAPIEFLVKDVQANDVSGLVEKMIAEANRKLGGA